MITEIESKEVFFISEAEIKSENPMQERHFGEIGESVELPAEAVFAARMLEAPGEAGPVFIP